MKEKNIDYEIELIINQKLYDSKKITKKIHKKVKDKLLKLNEKSNK